MQNLLQLFLLTEISCQAATYYEIAFVHKMVEYVYKVILQFILNSGAPFNLSNPSNCIPTHIKVVLLICSTCSEVQHQVCALSR